MTEGIIQKVFDRYTSNFFFEPVQQLHVNELEQELIAEIKKEFNDTTGKSYINDLTIRAMLIGEHRE